MRDTKQGGEKKILLEIIYLSLLCKHSVDAKKIWSASQVYYGSANGLQSTFYSLLDV